VTRRPSRPQLAFISATVFLSFIGFSLLVPVLPYLAERYVRGADQVAFVVGLLLSSYALCSFVAAPALGALSDRYGRRPVILVSLAGSVVGYLLLGIGGALWILFLGRVIDGLTGGNVSTAFAYIADVTEPDDRAKYYGLLGAVAGLGFMFGPPVGGLSAQIDIAAPLYLAAAVTLVNLVWGLVVLPESLSAEHRTGPVRLRELDPFAQFGQVLAVPALAQLFGAAFVFYVASNAVYGNAAVYLKDVFGWRASDVGTLLFVAGFFAAFAQGYLVRKLVPVLGAERVATLGLGVGVVGLLMAAATAAVRSVPLLYAGAIVFILGDGLFEPSSTGLISGAAGPRAQGRVQGASQAMQSISRIVGPLVANGVYVAGTALPWITEAVLVSVAFVILVRAIPAVRAASAAARAGQVAV
jgi:MFS transporter, DHA1 family, tetracycline resistance protein